MPLSNAMEGFEQATETKEKIRPRVRRESTGLLNAWDRDVLEYGLRNVINSMVENFGGKLPQAIVLADTSARPLMYALRPAFKKVIEERGGEMPHFYFFRPDTFSISDDIDAEEAREGGDAYARQELSDKKASARSSMRVRAEEILAFERRRGHENRSIAIVDEYATEDMHTIQEARKAFGFDVRAYTVFSQTDSGHSTGLHVEDAEKASLNPDSGGAGFSYSKTDAVGVTKEHLKARKYSEKTIPSSSAHSARIETLKRKLRQEMGSIGERVAETLEDDGYEKLSRRTGITDLNRAAAHSEAEPRFHEPQRPTPNRVGYDDSLFGRMRVWAMLLAWNLKKIFRMLRGE